MSLACTNYADPVDYDITDSLLSVVPERALSAAQLETTLVACSRHQNQLQDGSRAAFFLGDGAGGEDKTFTSGSLVHFKEPQIDVLPVLGCRSNSGQRPTDRVTHLRELASRSQAACLDLRVGGSGARCEARSPRSWGWVNQGRINNRL